MYLNNYDSELIFTSASDNRYITKIVIEFDKYYTRSNGASDTTNNNIVVNHGVWTDEAVTGSNGKHTLTMTGNAARRVTIRKDSDSAEYGIWGITSISFYLTDNLWDSVPEGFYMNELEDGGVRIDNGKASYGSAGIPFFVRLNGKITYFSTCDADNVQSYTIADPVVPFSFETYSADGFIANNTDDLITAVNSDKFNAVLLGCDLTVDEGFTISTSTEIDLGSNTLSCSASAQDKTISVTGGSSGITGTQSGCLQGFDKIVLSDGSLTL